jgi:hypothetical protein
MLALTISWLFMGQAYVEIAVEMSAWEFIPSVEIRQGRDRNCGVNRIVFEGPIKGPFRGEPYAGSGSNGEDICWRRTNDPPNPASGLSVWHRCTLDGVCTIN